MTQHHKKNRFTDERPSLSSMERDVMWQSIERAITPQMVVSPYQWLVRPRVALSAFLIVVVIASTSTVAAAQSARPGDRLFAIDQATEQARLLIASEGRAAELHALFLEERWEELASLLSESEASGAAPAPQVAVAVRTLLNQAEEVPEEKRKDVVLRLLGEFDDSDDDIDERLSDYRVRYQNDRIEIRTEDSRIKVDDDRIEIREDDYRVRIDEDGEVKYRFDDDRDDVNDDRDVNDDDRDSDISGSDDDRDDRDDDERDESDDKNDEDDDRDSDISGSDDDRDDDERDESHDKNDERDDNDDDRDSDTSGSGSGDDKEEDSTN